MGRGAIAAVDALAVVRAAVAAAAETLLPGALAVDVDAAIVGMIAAVGGGWTTGAETTEALPACGASLGGGTLRPSHQPIPNVVTMPAAMAMMETADDRRGGSIVGKVGIRRR